VSSVPLKLRRDAKVPPGRAAELLALPWVFTVPAAEDAAAAAACLPVAFVGDPLAFGCSEGKGPPPSIMGPEELEGPLDEDEGRAAGVERADCQASGEDDDASPTPLPLLLSEAPSCGGGHPTSELLPAGRGEPL